MPTKIPYCDAVLEVTGGCTKCSPGCLNCWAIKEVWRMAHNPLLGDKWQGLVEKKNGVLNWTGRIKLFEDALQIPLGRKKPTTYFIDSKADLFHPKVPWNYRLKAIRIMAQTPQHTYLILTKRIDIAKEGISFCMGYPYYKWPLLNVHLGVSISTQKEADEKIPILLQIPAAVRFVSAEPLLAPIDFSKIHWPYQWGHSGCHCHSHPHPDGTRGRHLHHHHDERCKCPIDQIIIGAESKGGYPGRPCELKWVKNLIGQADAAGVAVFVKQLHLWGVNWYSRLFETPQEAKLHLGECNPKLKLSKDPKEWPVWAQRQEYPK